MGFELKFNLSLGENFSGRNFSAERICGRNFFRPKNVSAEKVFGGNFFRSKIFSAEFILRPNFFRPKIFSAGNISVDFSSAENLLRR